MHLYDDAVAARLGGRKKLREVREAAPFTSPAFVGLGERYPSERPDQDGLDSERNRRVDLVFLDPDEAVYIEDKDSVETLLYAPESVARREWLPLGFPARADELVVKVQTEDGQPVPGAYCTLTLPGGDVREATLDAAGIVRFLGLPPVAGIFRLPDFEAFDWDAVADATRPLPPPPVHDDDPDEEPDDANLPPLTAAERRVFDLEDDDDEDDTET
ncbi:MAG TPA: carboxypeptidase-like regulatory domain-containing protein [Nannocystis sp.]